MDAARIGHSEAVQFMMEWSNAMCGRDVSGISYRLHESISMAQQVKWLYDKGASCSPGAMDGVVANGHYTFFSDFTISSFVVEERCGPELESTRLLEMCTSILLSC